MTTGEGTHDVGTLRENMAVVMDKVKDILLLLKDNGHDGLVTTAQKNRMAIEQLKKDLCEQEAELGNEITVKTTAIKSEIDAHIAEHKARQKELNDFLAKVWAAVISDSEKLASLWAAHPELHKG